MPIYPLNLDSSALIVIDMQKAFLDKNFPLAVPDAKKSIEKINQLILICRQANIPIIWTSHVLKADLSDQGMLAYTSVSETDLKISFADNRNGIDIFPKLEWQPNDLTIKKSRFSAFYKTNLEERLKAQNIDTLFVAGTILNVCCESTIRDAFFRDIKVFLPIDVNTTVDHPEVGFGSYTAREMANSIYTSLGRRFAHLTTADELMHQIKIKKII